MEFLVVFMIGCMLVGVCCLVVVNQGVGTTFVGYSFVERIKSTFKDHYISARVLTVVGSIGLVLFLYTFICLWVGDVVKYDRYYIEDCSTIEVEYMEFLPKGGYVESSKRTYVWFGHDFSSGVKPSLFLGYED